jgi:hypothetical protein
MGCPKPVFDTGFKGRIYTLSSYDGLVTDAIRIIKYKPSKCLLNELIQICLKVPSFDEFFRGDDVLVPAPMHIPGRKKEVSIRLQRLQRLLHENLTVNMRNR